MAFLDNIGLEHLWAHIIAKLGYKVDKVDGKGLSTNDYTDEDKAKVANLDVDGITPIEKGGTNATDAATARTNLGITPANIGALSTSGGSLNGTLHINGGPLYIKSITGDNEGGEIWLKAPSGNQTLNHLVIDNLGGKFRVFGAPSEDGTTVTTVGTPLVIDTYAKTISGGYTLNGNAATATTLSETLPIEKGGTGATSVSGARANMGIYSGTELPETGELGDIFILYSE